VSWKTTQIADFKNTHYTFCYFKFSNHPSGIYIVLAQLLPSNTTKTAKERHQKDYSEYLEETKLLITYTYSGTLSEEKNIYRKIKVPNHIKT
jgi:hypothetical protein